MRNFLCVIMLAFAVSASAQTSDLEKVIKDIEQREAKAVLDKDTTSLKHLWSTDFTVNNPMNMVAKPGKNVLDRPAITTFNYSSFNRTTEHVMILKDIVITMGHELVIDKNENGNPGKKINRRYTNIWTKQGQDWKLTARHASVICD